MDELVWSNWSLQHALVKPSWEDKVGADIAGVTVEQYMFNKWMNNAAISFDMLPEDQRVKLSRWKYFLWPVLSRRMLGTEEMNFMGWSIGHCLNCDASPYDGVVESWWKHGSIEHGALIRCNKCKQLRWQLGG